MGQAPGDRDRCPLGDPPLTVREREVLDLVAVGLTNREIGRRLFLGVETVRTHVRSVLRKLGVANRTQAAVLSGRSAGADRGGVADAAAGGEP